MVAGSISIDASDIQIGAVELKDGASDNRASISAAGALKVDGSAVTQPVTATDLDIRDLTSATDSVMVDFPNGAVDSFGHIVTGSVNNQIDIQFYRTDGSVADIISETNANGGTATATNGMATFSATTAASSRAKGVTNESTTYTAGAEVYAIFTAGFTGTGAGTSYQRIGLYDDYTNGFFIGKEANSFGVTILKGGSPVTTPQASFSEDTLQGGATSKFTRAGVPEAINLALLNVFRIHFGWVGSAPVEFEVLSPDGDWVAFHKIKQPNLSALPSINTADLPFTCDVNSGNSGNALTIITNCWAAGTTQALIQLNGARTLLDTDYAQLTRSVITGETTAGGGAYVNVKVNPSGAVSADVTGTVTANLSATDNAVLDNIDTNTDSGAVVGGGTEATAQRVTIANDSTGVLSVDDNAGSLTVDQSTHDNLNLNANLQVANTDVSASNPVRTKPVVLPLSTNVSSTLTLTSATTAYQITEPTSDFLVTYCNASDTDMYWGFATLTSGGIKLASGGGTVTMLCAANSSPFFYCGSAGKVLNYTTTVI